MHSMDKLSKALRNRGMSQVALARKLGITAQAVNNWTIRGKVPPRQALRVAKILRVPPTDLADFA